MGRCHVPVVQGKAVSRAGSADPRACLAAFVGYDPAMTSILPALVAGLLGVPFGGVARALARRYCGRPAVPGPLLIEALMAVLWALLALRLWPAHPAALPPHPAPGLVFVAPAGLGPPTQPLPPPLP